MTKLPQVRPKDLVKALEKAGFNKSRQTGSHLKPETLKELL